MKRTYRLTLIAVLASLCVVGRVAFQFLPNIQPVTAIIIITGFFLGPISAFFLAVITTYISNLFLGMGIWTIWQIVAWSFIGIFSGLIGKIHFKKPFILLFVYALLAGLFFGFTFAFTNYVITGKFLAYYLAGLPFDISHAIGNVLFLCVLYKPLSLIFKRYLQT
ncbi:ECF transporter S component [Paraliobacillus sediminis]|uniref:ECF transporter S component n=1 Tax=Paraliobacillus sediminis TaxID=1885916 RepID=UPI000E3E36FB|nr:ECF transporter S component [Paraliobacillus sediminis]